jgi:hypothetical protein
MSLYPRDWSGMPVVLRKPNVGALKRIVYSIRQRERLDLDESATRSGISELEERGGSDER